jgi:proline iminopeptidase
MTSSLKFIEIDGFKLHYTIEGSGKPALVIGSAIYYPRTFSQNLRNHLQLIFMDHRGFASSDNITDTKKFELDLLLDDVEKVRKHLNLENIIIIGHSGHGYMALEYAKKYPQHVSHVVLIAMGPDQSNVTMQAAEQYFNDTANPEQKAFLEEDLKKLYDDIKADPDKRFIHFCIRLGAKSWYDFTYNASKLWEGINVNMAMFDHVWGTVFRDIDITKDLEHFNKPVFLALGHFDFLVAPFFSWNPLRSKFKNLTVRLFGKSGHTPQLEESALFDTELLRWLSEHDSNN